LFAHREGSAGLASMVLSGSGAGGRYAMIQGLITSKDVFLRGNLIVREFGISTWLRCCLVLLTGRRTTFLEMVFAR
jgi:hypothetical protein